MSYQLLLLGLAGLIALGILLHHPSRTLGLPSLLIFMGVGLSIGNGEFSFIYDDLKLTSLVGGFALNVIVFVGGINTPMQSIKIAYKEGGVLSSFGVVLTSLIFATVFYLLFDYDFIYCLLFAAVLSSTDAAAVFSILESKKLKLKESTDTVLEFESATNDPVALIMVVILTQLSLFPELTIDPLEIGQTLVLQLLCGLLIGVVVGKVCVLALGRISLQEYGLIPVFVLACFIFASFGSELLGGNVLIACYAAGVLIGNGLQRGREVTKHFFNSLSWLAQAVMFVILGLQLFPQQLMDVFWVALLPSAILMLLARPLAVQVCYLPFRQVPWRKRLFISSIGLKGATPIVFALIPAAAGVSEASEMMHMVFFVVLYSVLIQGAMLEPLARRLGLAQE